jgi:hypothetical protein
MKKKEFENIFDECLERILLGGETLEQCLKRYPEQAAELKPLLETVLAVKKASAVEPRPEFKARARYQFRSALQEKAEPKRRPFFGWLPQWATALVIVLIVLVAGGGTVAAASNSMPDSILYPVKLATENVQLALTTSDIGRARLCASFADRRVDEIIYMAEKGDAHGVEVLTERLDDRLDRLVMLVSELDGEGAQLFEASGGGAPTNVESADSDGAPPPEEPAEPPPPVVEESGGLDQGEAQNRAGLTVKVAQSVDNNQAMMWDIVDEVPESVREALLEAIAVMEAGYEEVLEALME